MEASLGKRGDVVLREMKKVFKKGGNTKRNKNLRNSSVPQISSRDNPAHRSTKSSVMQQSNKIVDPRNDSASKISLIDTQIRENVRYGGEVNGRKKFIQV